ncbi:MAG: peptidase U62 modulator of DNA gyrase [Candidatus Xenolissoclinum pacificiensis L6]|uniref:Peptidase U62 modulator of DNA gyrase n=1 Tax=Candidatus Xenolissoclinum pacificiensis L6 TaxID=1401685 RepID=W2UZU0_9RICK|nr:MAG: peptidase U62 modulator of DNA gyrase [Candidatus Xenolissoclinum pacificiensis L6]
MSFNLSVDHVICGNTVMSAVSDALSVYDNGELFYEDYTSEVLVFEDSSLRDYNKSRREGVSIRGFSRGKVSFVHSPIVSQESMVDLSKKVRNHTLIQPSIQNNKPVNNRELVNDLYSRVGEDDKLINKIQVLHEIDKLIRDKNSLVKQVKITLQVSSQSVAILPKSMKYLSDRRPLVSLSVIVVIEKEGVSAQGSKIIGGRKSIDLLLESKIEVAQSALDQAIVNLDAKSCPGGMMPVILSNGFCGILLHEAVGHGLEGDFIRKGLSTFHNLYGKKIAQDGITVLDSGIIKERRGSLNFDDEGTVTQETVLIKDGVLVGHMQDNINAALMGVESTGNCRRENYSYQPMPRMTNTYMSPGNASKEEIISSVDRAIYAVAFGGGQVNITNGKFVFSTVEAYLVENGKIQHPVRGITIIGDGATVLKNISMIGNDLELDSGSGMCGKDGQSIPVGVGQPTVKIDEILVGGTQV